MVARDKVVTPIFGSSALEGAIEAYLGRFGSAPELLGLRDTGRDRQLAALIWVAIRVGKPFDADAVLK